MAVGDIPRVKRPYTAPLLERMPIESTANASAQNSDTLEFHDNTAFPPQPGS